MRSLTRALIVETHWSEAQQLTRLLESHGIETLGVAANGADALRYCEALQPDLVLLDIDLDGPVNGVDLIVPIRALGPIALVFVVRDAGDTRIARLAGIASSSYVVKPVQDAELRRAVATALQRPPDEALATRDSEQAFAQVFDVAPDAMLLIRADGQISRVNLAFARQFGYDPVDVVGQPVEILVPRASRAGHVQHRRWFAQHPHVRRMGERQPLVACRADGREFPVDISLAPFGTGPDARILAIVRDVSERRLLAEAQRERHALEEQLERVLRLETVGRLAGGIAHDFNNLLMVIGGYVDVLLTGDIEPAKQRRLLEGVRATTDRATELTRQLLAFGRRQVLQPRAVDIGGCLEAMGGLMSRAIGESIEIVTTIAADARPVQVDASQLEQVLLNLALNARDAMSRGGTLRFEVTNMPVGEGMRLPGQSANAMPAGDYVRLAVRDNGCGMAADTVARAFEPFFTTKGPGRGIGMGLASVYGIVKQSGGAIWIESQPGEGTCVVLLLPAAAGLPETGTQSPTAAPAPAARILLVEDEPEVRAMLKDCLEASGYEVVEAADGQAALCRYRVEAPLLDLIITDVIMPKCGGPQLVSAIRDLHPGVLAIFMSGYANDPDSADLQRNERTAFLQKPFATERLRTQVAELLSTRKRAPPPLA
ncbi:MAG: response regulator [Vicinamibacterales bacterium]